MTWCLTGILIGILAAAWFAFEKLRRVYEDQICMLEEDRDLARNEAKTYLGLLCPVTNKPAAVSGDVGRSLNGQAAPRAEQAPRADVSPEAVYRFALSDASHPERRVRSRVPFRLRFNQMRQLTNSKQQKINALAKALVQRKPFKEKANV